jgi:hypothetical protein
VRTGAVMAVQDVTVSTISLPLATQKGVDLNATSVDFTMNLSQEDWTRDVIEPAMAVLAANVEADALSMIKDVWNQVNNIGAAGTFAKLLAGRKQLNDNLAPMDSSRFVLLNTQDNVDIITDAKGLFQDSEAIKKQYKEGMMGRTAGFDFFENTLLSKFTSGSDANGYAVVRRRPDRRRGHDQRGAGGTFKKGDIVTFAGCNRVHPETKADTGRCRPSSSRRTTPAARATSPSRPSIVVAGATQNVTASPTNGGAVTKQGGALAVYGQSIAAHKDAFAFVTADLYLPKNQPVAVREVYDGISLRMWQGADITNDKHPLRLDVLYGFKTIRGQLASRLANN